MNSRCNKYKESVRLGSRILLACLMPWLMFCTFGNLIYHPVRFLGTTSLVRDMVLKCTISHLFSQTPYTVL